MNSIEKCWRDLLKTVLTYGEWRVKDDGDNILEHIDNHCFIPNVSDSLFPTGQGFSLDLFKRLVGEGKFNVDGYPIKDIALLSYVEQLEDDSQIYLDGESFVYTYPERLFNVKQADKTDDAVVYSNQVDVMINRLKEHSGSNRSVANLYMCSLDGLEQHIPCLNFVQALIRDNTLCLHIMFRSNDLYSAFVSNMFFIQYLGLMITEELRKEYPSLHFGGVYYNSTSLHIYKGDYEQAQKVLREG